MSNRKGLSTQWSGREKTGAFPRRSPLALGGRRARAGHPALSASTVAAVQFYPADRGLGEERREDAEQEVVLQLVHVGVEPPVGLPVTLDVEEEHPPLAGLRLLRPVDEPEERARRFLEPLVGSTTW
jgi:hypothetical protein